MESFEHTTAKETELEKEAEIFTLDKVGALTDDMDWKKYWETYYDVYYNYLINHGWLDQNTEKKREYKYFYYPEAREELFKFSKAIAEYIHDNNISDLVIVDRSSRPLYIGVIEYWHSAFPDKPIPGIFFINPSGFKHSGKETEEELEGLYKKLSANKKKPILMFDTCIHSGNTLSPVVDFFKDNGFEKLIVGSVNPSDYGSQVKTDFYITEKRPEKGCYPFDRDRMIEKTFDHIYSQHTRDEDAIERSKELRGEIRDIVREHIGKQN